MHFHVTWPPVLLNMMEWSKGTFNFDVIALPGLACLSAEISFTAKLIIYTVAPLVMLVLLGLPLVPAWLLVHSHGWEGEWGLKAEATIDRFWNNIDFAFFVLYPVVSTTSLQAFDCQPSGLGLLSSDYRELCPASLSFISLYSAAFSLLYALGLPIFFYASLLHLSVGKVAKSKIEDSILRAMILAFLKDTSSVESQRLSRLVGSPSEIEEFERRCMQVYSHYFTSEGVLSEHTLGADKVMMIDLVQQYDANGDGRVDAGEFQAMMRAVLRDTTVFTGAERGYEINAEQLQCLSTHKFSNCRSKEDATGSFITNSFSNKTPQKIRRRNIDDGLNESTCHTVTVAEPHQELNVEILRAQALALGRDMVKRGVLVYDEPVWDSPGAVQEVFSGEEGSKNDIMRRLESMAIRRVGFIFLTYRVGYWWWEITEMTRKYDFLLYLRYIFS
jgi:hypothetical protein